MVQTAKYEEGILTAEFRSDYEHYQKGVEMISLFLERKKKHETIVKNKNGGSDGMCSEGNHNSL